VELDAGVLCVRGCFGMCAVLVLLVPDFVAVRLSPRGDFSCRDVVVPVVAWLLVVVVITGDGVEMLGIG
jgi:hypothetical protein